MRDETIFFLLVIVACSSFLIYQNAYAITVSPGASFQNTNLNYTSFVKPNFNVTSITVNSTDIFFGTPYYDLTWAGHKINANITAFSEGVNFTGKILSSGTSGVTMNVLGQLQQVILGHVKQNYGTTWGYTTCRGLACTYITIGTNTDFSLGWVGNSTTTANLLASGYVLATSAYFNNPTLTLTSPTTGQVTSLLLWDTNGNLANFQNFSPAITVLANNATKIPSNLQDNSNPTGTHTYYEQAVIQTSSGVTIVTSNQVPLTFGSFQSNNLNFNQTNTNTENIYFIRNDLNTTDTRLSVIYLNSMNMQCNFGYVFAMTNKTYGPPLANIPYISLPQVNSSFQFHNIANEIINVHCEDVISKQNATYVLTQTHFPFQQQIANFRNGTYGTQGQFGIFDFTSLAVIILSMIGFNRKNEAVGAFFCIGIVGAAAFFQIVTLPTFIIGAVIVIAMLAYMSTRKQSDPF